MIRCLVEVGLGVRHSPPRDVDWYMEPAVRLALLHRKLAEEADHSLSQLLHLMLAQRNFAEEADHSLVPLLHLKLAEAISSGMERKSKNLRALRI
jgi:hypothetical protein